jgi:solute:Na+ symporter, SSS family
MAPHRSSYYAVNPTLKATLGSSDQVLPHFIANVLPVGVAGLVIAGMLAATMSSVSAGINSLSTVTTIGYSPSRAARVANCRRECS